jgi:GMP synthase (glutamine-hydrolysing)
MNLPSSAHASGGRSDSLLNERVLVLDFGSQFAQLIARRVREQNVYCEIVRHDISAETMQARKPAALILSGGPSSVYDTNAPQCDPGIFELGIPILGICYGMQLTAYRMGGSVKPCPAREFGTGSIADQQHGKALCTGFPHEIDVG